MKEATHLCNHLIASLAIRFCAKASLANVLKIISKVNQTKKILIKTLATAF